MNNLRYIFVFLMSLSFWQSSAQQHPFSLQWRLLETDHFKIIYPEGIENQAQNIANLVEYSSKPVSEDMLFRPPKSSIILSNQSAVSNAYMALAPKRIYWGLTPIQNSRFLSGTDWTQTLASHEYRHLTQNAFLNRGFIRFGSIVWGQYGQAVLTNLTVPLWFFEGDAVYMESKLTSTGRGEMPAFSMGYRAMAYWNKEFSYDQAYQGSFNKYYPDFYKLGYLLHSHVRRNYGEKVWNTVLRRVSRNAYSPFTFSISLKKATGYNLRNTLRNAMSEFDSIAHKQIENISYSPAMKFKTAVKKAWTNYYDPQYINDEEIIARKAGLSHLSQIVSVKRTGEEKILGYCNTYDRISSGNNKVVWSMNVSDIRWSGRSYSDIYIYNLKTKKKNRLTRKQKFFVPAVSPDGDKIVTVEFPEDLGCSLVILDALSGTVISKYSLNNEFFRNPAWSDNGKEIIFTHTKDQKQAISLLNIENEEIKTILPYTFQNISNPVFYKHYVLYNSPRSGIDNIYAVDTLSGDVFQVSSRRFGAFNAAVSPEKNKMLFMDYQVDGFNIAEAAINEKDWVLMKKEEVLRSHIFTKDSIPEKTYKSKEYNKFSNSISIHSWSPGTSPQSLKFTVFSDNPLNTCSFYTGIEYNYNIAEQNVFLGFQYSGWFPVINVSGLSGFTTHISQNDIGYSFYHVKENTFVSDLGIPLNFSEGSATNFLTLCSGMGQAYINTQNRRQQNVSYSMAISYLAIESIMKRNKASKDIYTPFGQTTRIFYNKSFGFFDYSGFFADAKVYLPGFAKHHNLIIEAVYQENFSDGIMSSLVFQEILYTRGYQDNYFSQYSRLSASYSLPIAYPNFALGSLFYIKRIRNKFFYDYSNCTPVESNRDFLLASFGTELFFDLTMLRLPAPINFGIRYSYRLWDNTTWIDLVLIDTDLEYVGSLYRKFTSSF